MRAVAEHDDAAGPTGPAGAAPSTLPPATPSPASSPSSRPDIPDLDAAGARRLRQMVDDYIDFVARVLRNAGTPERDIDDEVQRTFIVATRRLADIRQGAEKAFLAQTALHLAAHARRTIARRREVFGHETVPEIDHVATPEALADRTRFRRLLDRILDQMETNLRTVFVLYEFEEMSMAEIADILTIPQGTVASRLRRARAEFRARVRNLEETLVNEEKS
jgi:RNA polymerase sigma-70 factor (ECF subfamily)